MDLSNSHFVVNSYSNDSSLAPFLDWKCRSHFLTHAQSITSAWAHYFTQSWTSISRSIKIVHVQCPIHVDRQFALITIVSHILVVFVLPFRWVLQIVAYEHLCSPKCVFHIFGFTFTCFHFNYCSFHVICCLACVIFTIVHISQDSFSLYKLSSFCVLFVTQSMYACSGGFKGLPLCEWVGIIM